MLEAWKIRKGKLRFCGDYELRDAVIIPGAGEAGEKMAYPRAQDHCTSEAMEHVLLLLTVGTITTNQQSTRGLPSHGPPEPESMSEMLLESVILGRNPRGCYSCKRQQKRQEENKMISLSLYLLLLEFPIGKIKLEGKLVCRLPAPCDPDGSGSRDKAAAPWASERSGTGAGRCLHF